jgi:hypothetical protein
MFILRSISIEVGGNCGLIDNASIRKHEEVDEANWNEILDIKLMS